MKKTIITSVILTGAIAMTACGQQQNVPGPVKQSFNERFSNAKNVKWEQEEENEWEAEFKMDGKEYSANYDPQGQWLETEYEIKKQDIPAAVKTTLDKDFGNYKIEEAEISETAQGKAYEFELEAGESTIEVSLDANGKLLKKEVKEEDEKEN